MNIQHDITIALTKGRILKETLPLLASVGIEPQEDLDASRKLILKGVDGVVFVADSQIERMEANVESLDNLRVNLKEQGYELDKIPYVIQYNKRDLPNAAPLEELQRLLNPTGAPEFEACATTGQGVFETLKATAKGVLADLKKMGS